MTGDPVCVVLCPHRALQNSPQIEDSTSETSTRWSSYNTKTSIICSNLMIEIYFLFYVAFNSLGHIAMGSLRVEHPVHTSWSRFCSVNHWTSASYSQLSNMKHPGRDSNQQPQRLKASTLNCYTTEPPSNLAKSKTKEVGSKKSQFYYFKVATTS